MDDKSCLNMKLILPMCFPSPVELSTWERLDSIWFLHFL